MDDPPRTGAFLANRVSAGVRMSAQPWLQERRASLSWPVSPASGTREAAASIRWLDLLDAPRRGKARDRRRRVGARAALDRTPQQHAQCIRIGSAARE